MKKEEQNGCYIIRRGKKTWKFEKDAYWEYITKKIKDEIAHHITYFIHYPNNKPQSLLQKAIYNEWILQDKPMQISSVDLDTFYIALENEKYDIQDKEHTNVFHTLLWRTIEKYEILVLNYYILSEKIPGVQEVKKGE